MRDSNKYKSNYEIIANNNAKQSVKSETNESSLAVAIVFKQRDTCIN